MDFKNLAVSRITPKFANGNNFKNVLRFMNDIFDDTLTDVELIRDLKNMGSNNSIVLDELGKLLGIFPRPLIEIGVTGEGFMTWDISEWGTVPFFTTGSETSRTLTNAEYTRVLRSYAAGTTFNGTIDEWSNAIGLMVDARVYIVNKASTYDIVVLKTLTQFEKNLVEFLLNGIDNLTVEKGFLGTSDGEQPFQFDITGWDTSPFITDW